MAINRILEREHEMAVQEEVTYGTDPGAAVGADMFKHQAAPDAVQRVIARYDRDQDNDYQQASVLSTQKGRESTTITIPCDLIPSGNASTPTEPDIDLLVKAVLGQKHKGTAHTTAGAGSSGTTLNLAAGGGAASGITAGDIIAVDLDGAGAYEARQVVSIVTDVVTIDRAFTSSPAATRAVKVGTTYRLLHSAMISLILKRWLAGDTLRYKVPGMILPELEISIDNSADVPVGKITFSGEGKAEATHSDARPTPVTSGQALVPTDSRVWFGNTKLCIAGNATLTVNNGLELRANESCSLEPTGVKRTGNEKGRYMVTMAIDLLLTTGDEDTSALYAAAQAFTAQDVLVQLGKTPGSIVAWRCPRFIPEPGLTARDGEMGINYGGGRCYGTTNDDEVAIAFI